MVLVEAAEAGDNGATEIVEGFNQHLEATAQMQADALRAIAPPEGEQGEQSQTSQEQTKQGQEQPTPSA